MFSIFRKNIYLVDLIDGITDFHNHVLPGIDDGAKDIDESVSLINGFKEIGVKNIIATPHVIGEYYPNTPETISKAYKLLVSEIESEILIGYSAEYMLDQHFLGILEKDEVITIRDKKILVEMSYFQPPLNLNEILFKIQNHSFSPILAHPERYAFYHSKDLAKYKDLKGRGCQFQLNMLSLSGHYGNGIQKIAFKLLEGNFIDFICSDAHRIDHIDKIKNIKVPEKFQSAIESSVENNKQLFI
ncbi:histidinol phosphatase [Gramella lutea]|uniref:protein-tyrosine-phosphatase n=1 Tax=Christiangramia lutea TaxID=1607951 RepID=A0A9X1V7F6_9FLAO|nr:CpsB/CapC family capsule biosynthesis tyrosine phosphatase [Christiangramia lutea]MCH4823823.1 histidinol phosphatase [Christiangramia lutea]